jgi:methylated-DNA-[protein]-cysteine S-methyltransferase
MIKCTYAYETPAGRLWLAEEDGSLTDVSFRPVGAAEAFETALLRDASQQLREYFKGKRQSFDLPLDARGTEFQKSVWAALRDIPYGQTRSYADIAIAIGKPTACRAVGSANNKNPIAILIPCHRVIGAGGGLAGYAGGLEIKRLLLELEQKNK